MALLSPSFQLLLLCFFLYNFFVSFRCVHENDLVKSWSCSSCYSVSIVITYKFFHWSGNVIKSRDFEMWNFYMIPVGFSENQVGWAYWFQHLISLSCSLRQSEIRWIWLVSYRSSYFMTPKDNFDSLLVRVKWDDSVVPFDSSMKDSARYLSNFFGLVLLDFHQ